MAKGTLNKVLLIGRLGNDPELRYTPAGDAVANFSLATNEAWKDQEGNPKEKTEWHRVVVWRKLAEFCGQYIKKGSHIYVEGRLTTQSWQDKDGNKKYSTQIMANQIQLLDPKPETGKVEQKTEPVKEESKNPFDKPSEEPKSEETEENKGVGWGDEEIPF